jgi:cytochrome c-type biogenesis protein CcmH/NrfG
MIRALAWLVVATAATLLSGVAAAQDESQFDIVLVKTDRHHQQRPSRRAQREDDERQSQLFAEQRRACLRDDVAACDQALAYSGITSGDRQLLSAKRAGVIAQREAAERARMEAEAAGAAEAIEQQRIEQDRIEQERLAAPAEPQTHQESEQPAAPAVWASPGFLIAASVAAAVGLLSLLFYFILRAGSLRSEAGSHRSNDPGRVQAGIAAAAEKLRDLVPDRPAPVAGAPRIAVERPALSTINLPRDTAAAVAALELAHAYIEEMREAEVPEREDAVMRRLHLNTLVLASKQLDVAQRLDSEAVLEVVNGQGVSRRLSINELRAEGLLLEGLTHQARDIKRAIQALAAAIQADPNNPHAFFALGLSQAANKNKAAAVAALHRAVALKPRNMLYRKELNRAENLTGAEVAGYKATRPGDRIVNAGIAGRGIGAVAGNIAAFPLRAVVSTIRFVRPSSFR